MSGRRLLGGGGPTGPERSGGRAPAATRLPGPGAQAPAPPEVPPAAGRVVGRHLLLLLLAGWANAAELRVDATSPWSDPNGNTPVLVSVASVTSDPVRIHATAGSGEAAMTLKAPGTATVLVPTQGGGSVTLVASGIPGLTIHEWTCSPEHEAGSIDAVVVDEGGTALDTLRATLTAAKPSLPHHQRFPYRHSSGGSYDAGQRIVPLSAGQLPDRWQGYPDWLLVVLTPAGERSLSAAQVAALAAWGQATGQLVVTTPGQVAAWDARGARAQLLTPDQALPLLTKLWDRGDYQPEHTPVPGLTGVPVGIFVTVALLFAVVAGPINLWVLARGRRERLLITTPLISLGTCGVLLIGGLLADGLGTHRVATQLMVLDQGAHQAVTWTGLGLFAGTAPGRFPLDPADRLRGQDRDDYRWHWRNEDGSTRGLEGVTAATGAWVPARLPRQLAIATVRPERRRILVTGDQVQNGFDMALTRVWWQDGKGRWQTARNIPAAGTATLEPSDGPPPALPLGRLGSDATPLAEHPGVVVAQLASPALPIPGPEADDATPPDAWLMTWSAP